MPTVETGPPNGLIQSLPEECIREILLRLSDPKDVERAGDTCITMGTIAREKRVWRELVQTHFTKQQVEFVLKEKKDLREQRDWKQLYRVLRRKFGLKEEYTEMLHLCRKCRSLFWQSIGHPCLLTDDDSGGNDSGNNDSGNNDSGNNAGDDDSISVDINVPIKPQTFLTFFSV